MNRFAREAIAPATVLKVGSQECWKNIYLNSYMTAAVAIRITKPLILGLTDSQYSCSGSLDIEMLS